MAGRRPPQPAKLSDARSAPSVRAATEADAEAIAAIHNQGIGERSATFETRLKSAEPIAERIAHWGLYLVAEEEGEVIGFAKAGPYEDRSHYYEGIGEATIFVERDHREHGAGRALLEALVEAARRRGLHKLTAKIIAGNGASIRLFESSGFRIVGTHERHGQLEGEWLDVVVLERSL
ncbi:MAG TPA: GNAT family N-acetyltransferase [Solirubrobacterales bacterium]|nr:GNAT family N-acetyltransferase [Solirubrobacterales bacterium]